MRTLTKTLTLLVIAGMLTGILAACSPAASPTATAQVEPTAVVAPTQVPTVVAPTEAPKTEPIKLTFWHNWEGANGDIMKELIDRFNKQNLDIQVEAVFQPYADIMTLYQTSIAGGTTPDVAALAAPLKPAPEKGGGYSLSEHVKHYYRTTRV